MSFVFSSFSFYGPSKWCYSLLYFFKPRCFILIILLYKDVIISLFAMRFIEETTNRQMRERERERERESKEERRTKSKFFQRSKRIIEEWPQLALLCWYRVLIVYHACHTLYSCYSSIFLDHINVEVKQEEEEEEEGEGEKKEKEKRRRSSKRSSRSRRE